MYGQEQKKNTKTKTEIIELTEIKENLVSETLKWLKKIEDELKKRGLAEETSYQNNKYIENIKAYIEDCKWFLNKKDYIRAFECIIWAWAWLEICSELNLLKKFNNR